MMWETHTVSVVCKGHRQVCVCETLLKWKNSGDICKNSSWKREGTRRWMTCLFLVKEIKWLKWGQWYHGGIKNQRQTAKPRLASSSVSQAWWASFVRDAVLEPRTPKMSVMFVTLGHCRGVKTNMRCKPQQRFNRCYVDSVLTTHFFRYKHLTQTYS